MKTGFQIVGTFKVKLAYKDGTIQTITRKNMIVNYGLYGLAGVIAGVAFPSTGGFPYLAMGYESSSTNPSLGDEALKGELRRDLVVVEQLAEPSANQVQFQIEHAAGAVSGDFNEAGLFDASTLGNMFNRITFPTLSVSTGDTLTVTWLIEIRNA